MNKKLEIKSFEHKIGTTSGKPYCKFETSEGWLSCFDVTMIDHLKTMVGKSLMVELGGKGDYLNKNIVRICEPGAIEDDVVPVVKVGQDPRDSVQTIPLMDLGKKVYPKDPVGLAVELMCYGHSAEQAIADVKQVRDAFK